MRRFLVARRAGDAVEMRRWWEELVIDFRDRMDGLVAATHKGRLDDFEHEDAVQRALTRFSTKLVDSFEGTSVGQLVNATKQLCWYACVDVQEEAAKRRQGARSLDEGWEQPADDDRASPNWEAKPAREAFDLASLQTDVREFLAWAVPQLVGSRRAVFERSYAGATREEICKELDISDQNAYQLRSRAMKDLAKLYQQYGS